MRWISTAEMSVSTVQQSEATGSGSLEEEQARFAQAYERAEAALRRLREGAAQQKAEKWGREVDEDRLSGPSYCRVDDETLGDNVFSLTLVEDAPEKETSVEQSAAQESRYEDSVAREGEASLCLSMPRVGSDELPAGYVVDHESLSWSSLGSIYYGRGNYFQQPTCAVHTHKFDPLALHVSAPPHDKALPPELASASAATSRPCPWHKGAPAPAPPAMRPMSAPPGRRKTSVRQRVARWQPGASQKTPRRVLLLPHGAPVNTEVPMSSKSKP